MNKMIAGNKIFGPTYKRAYPWDTETEKGNIPKQVNIFLSDLEEYIKSSTNAPYYFGHFLFEQKLDGTFGIIDGQQRLTTIVIFLSVLFSRLKQLRKLKDNEEVIYENMNKRKSYYTYSTVNYDNQLFRD